MFGHNKNAFVFYLVHEEYLCLESWRSSDEWMSQWLSGWGLPRIINQGVISLCSFDVLQWYIGQMILHIYYHTSQMIHQNVIGIFDDLQQYWTDDFTIFIII